MSGKRHLGDAAASAIAGAALVRSVAAMGDHDQHDEAPPAVASRASSPRQLTKENWQAVAKRVVVEARQDNVSLLAGGVAFYALLALVPAVVAIVSIYGMVADPASVTQQLTDATEALPPDAARVLVDQIEQVVGRPDAGLGVTAALGIALALWSASAGMKSLMGAIGLAYDQPEGRRFVKLRGTALALTAGAIVTLIANFVLVTQAAALAERWGLGDVGRWTVAILRWPLLAAVLVVGTAVLYRFGPDRRAAEWRWITPGSVVATALAIVASAGLSLYTAVVDVAAGAGPLASIAVLMLWLMVSALALLLGAEINAELEREVLTDTTVGPERPLGERGAVVADALPPVG